MLFGYRLGTSMFRTRVITPSDMCFFTVGVTIHLAKSLRKFLATQKKQPKNPQQDASLIYFQPTNTASTPGSFCVDTLKPESILLRRVKQPFWLPQLQTLS